MDGEGTGYGFTLYPPLRRAVSPRTPHAGDLFLGFVHSELCCGLYSFLSGLLHLNFMCESIWVAAWISITWIFTLPGISLWICTVSSYSWWTLASFIAWSCGGCCCCDMFAHMLLMCVHRRLWWASCGGVAVSYSTCSVLASDWLLRDYWELCRFVSCQLGEPQVRHIRTVNGVVQIVCMSMCVRTHTHAKCVCAHVCVHIHMPSACAYVCTHIHAHVCSFNIIVHMVCGSNIIVHVVNILVLYKIDIA